MKRKKDDWTVKRFEVDVIEGKLALVWPVGEDGMIERNRRNIVAVNKNGTLTFKV